MSIAERRQGAQQGTPNDCAREGLSTCRKIKDSGLHAESFPVGASQIHTDGARTIRVKPELVVRELRF